MGTARVSLTAGMGCVGVLTVVFIILKLLGKITWSWWWILSPIWIAAAYVSAVALILCAIALICFIAIAPWPSNNEALADNEVNIL